MRALVLPRLGGWEQLTVAEVPAPAIRRPDDVRVRVHSAGINHLDLFILDGLPGITYTFPHIVGSDAAGTVESVGANVKEWAVGDRVMMNPGIGCNECALCAADQQPLCRKYGLLGEHIPGTAGEFVVVPAGNLARVPEGMPWAQAAGFSLATLTAWRMMTARARVRAGETVLHLGHRWRRGAGLPAHRQDAGGHRPRHEFVGRQARARPRAGCRPPAQSPDRGRAEGGAGPDRRTERRRHRRQRR